MKPIKVIPVLTFISMIILNGCVKTDEGPVGEKEIAGSVTYLNGATGNNEPAPSAFVHIAYGTTSATTNYNETIVADAAGKYNIKGLAKGDYFVTGEYTDKYGFKYQTPGYGVTIKDKNSKLQVDISLK